MAAIVRHGEKWRAFFYRHGVRRTKVFATKTEARIWVEQVGVEVGAVEYGSETAALHRAVDRYIREVCPTHRGERWERLRLERIKRELKDRPLRDVTPRMLAEWRDGKTLAPASIRRDMGLLTSFFWHCVSAWGYLAKSPMAGVRKPSPPPARRRGVSADEIEAICAGLNWRDDLPVIQFKQQVALAFLVSIETGMRKGELLGLVPERMHLERRFVELDLTKNGDRRQVPLSSRAVFLLGKLPEGRFTVSSATADALFRKARPAGVHFHDARSEAITRLARKLDVLDLARMIGHRDIKSLMIYYAESAESIARRLD